MILYKKFSIFEYSKLNIIIVRHVAIEKSKRLNIMNGKNNARPNGATIRMPTRIPRRNQKAIQRQPECNLNATLLQTEGNLKAT